MTFHPVHEFNRNAILEPPLWGEPPLVALPPKTLLESETLFWQLTQRGVKDSNKASTVNLVALDAQERMRAIAEEIEEFKAEGVPDPEFRRQLGWIALTTLAHYMMFREMIENKLLEEAVYKPWDKEVEFAGDLDDEDFCRSGILVLDDKATATLGISRIPPYDETEWYEGKRIYLRVSRPANPTDAMESDYQMRFGKALDRTISTSIVPRVKRGYWSKVTTSS